MHEIEGIKNLLQQNGGNMVVTYTCPAPSPNILQSVHHRHHINFNRFQTNPQGSSGLGIFITQAMLGLKLMLNS